MSASEQPIVLTFRPSVIDPEAVALFYDDLVAVVTPLGATTPTGATHAWAVTNRIGRYRGDQTRTGVGEGMRVCAAEAANAVAEVAGVTVCRFEVEA